MEDEDTSSSRAPAQSAERRLGGSWERKGRSIPRPRSRTKQKHSETLHPTSAGRCRRSRRSRRAPGRRRGARGSREGGGAQGTLELRRGGEEGQTAHKAPLSTNELNLTASEPTSLPTPTPTDPETPLWRSTRSDDVEEEPERRETLELQEGGFKGGRQRRAFLTSDLAASEPLACQSQPQTQNLCGARRPLPQCQGCVCVCCLPNMCLSEL